MAKILGCALNHFGIKIAYSITTNYRMLKLECFCDYLYNTNQESL